MRQASSKCLDLKSNEKKSILSRRLIICEGTEGLKTVCSCNSMIVSVQLKPFKMPGE